MIALSTSETSLTSTIASSTSNPSLSDDAPLVSSAFIQPIPEETTYDASGQISSAPFVTGPDVVATQDTGGDDAIPLVAVSHADAAPLESTQIPTTASATSLESNVTNTTDVTQATDGAETFVTAVAYDGNTVAGDTVTDASAFVTIESDSDGQILASPSSATLESDWSASAPAAESFAEPIAVAPAFVDDLSSSSGQDDLVVTTPIVSLDNSTAPDAIALSPSDVTLDSGLVDTAATEDSTAVNEVATAQAQRTPPNADTTQLFAAIESGDQATVLQLLETGDIDLTAQEDSYGNTPILQAVYSGNAEAASALLAADSTGASLQVSSDAETGNNNPLLLALKRGEGEVTSAIVDKLGELDANVATDIVKQSDSRGATALHWAAIDRDDALIDSLIALNADPTATTAFGRTAGDLYQKEISFDDLDFPDGVTFLTAESNTEYSATNDPDLSNFRWHGIAKAQNELADIGNPFLPDDFQSPTNNNLTTDFIDRLGVDDYSNQTKPLLDLAKLSFVKTRADKPASEATLARLPTTPGNQAQAPVRTDAEQQQARTDLDNQIDRAIGSTYEFVAKKLGG